jgi:hypothetical protein
MRVERGYKSVKKHDGHVNNHPARKLGAFRPLPFVVRNVSEMQRGNHFRRCKGAVAYSQEKLQVFKSQVASAVS